MRDIKNYREKELKNYVVGNIFIFIVFSNKIQTIIEIGNSYIDMVGNIIETMLISSIIYIYFSYGCNNI